MEGAHRRCRSTIFRYNLYTVKWRDPRYTILRVLKNIYSYNHHPNKKSEHSHHSRKFPLPLSFQSIPTAIDNQWWNICPHSLFYMLTNITWNHGDCTLAFNFFQSCFLRYIHIVVLFHRFIYLSLPVCFDYFSFILSPEIRQTLPVSFFKMVLAILGPLLLCKNF